MEENIAVTQTPQPPPPTPPTQPISSTTQIPATPPQKKKIPSIVAVLLLLLLLGLLGGGSYIMNMKKQASPTPTPKPTSKPSATPSPTTSNIDTANWKTYHGESFTFSYPSSCIIEKANYGKFIGTPEIITCKTEGFSIVPHAGGHGADIVKSETITLNKMMWTRTLFNSNPPEMGASYAIRENGNSELFEVHYDNYTPQAEKKLEEIIASFTFTK